MRAVRSFDPCLPCGVHMYTGGGHGAEGGAHAHGAGLGGHGDGRMATDADAAGRARPGAHGAARGARRTRPRATLAEELVVGDRADVRRRARADRRGDRRRRAGRRAIASALAEDGVVASLLLIHDLYPVPLEERVHGGARRGAALHGVARRQRRAARRRGRRRPAAAGGQLQRLRGLVVDARAGVEQALEEAAPDLEGMEVEGVLEDAGGADRPAAAADVRARRRRRWFDARRAGALAPERARGRRRSAGAPLVVANVDGTLLAYRDALRRLRRRARRRRCSPAAR